MNIHFINTPPDTRQRKRHSGGSNSEDSALAHGKEVESGNREYYVRDQEDPAVGRNIRTSFAVVEMACEPMLYGTVQFYWRQSLN